MSITKNPFIRYQILDRCLSNRGRNYTLDALLEECNRELREQGKVDSQIKRRQLQDDIGFIETKIEIIRDYTGGKKPYYRYEDMNSSLFGAPLNPLQLDQLRSTLEILSSIEGMPQIEWLEKMILHNESKIEAELAERKMIEFESNFDYEGRFHIGPIFNAIYNKRVLDVTYQDFKSEYPYKLVLHPYYLKQYKNRWFCFGLKEGDDRFPFNLALDRIKETKELNEEFIEDETETHWQDFFDQMIGVTKGDGDPIEVKLLFTKEQAPYIETKPIHGTQKTEIQKDGKLEVRIEVVPNFELEMQLLSFGEKVEVLKPASLRNRISERLNAATSKY